MTRMFLAETQRRRDILELYIFETEKFWFLGELRVLRARRLWVPSCPC